MKKIYFITKSHRLSLTISGEDANCEQWGLLQILSIFANECTSEGLSIESLQMNSIEIQSKIATLVSQMKETNLKLHRLSDFFNKKLEANEWFYISTDEKDIREGLHQLQNFLGAIAAPKEDKALYDKVSEVLAKIEDVYRIVTLDESTKGSIGELDKKKRVCRFCHRSMPEVTFKEVAHTIPEALGNKNIKTNDECDECNHQFGATIEQDFLSIFDTARIIFDIKGKNGTPHKLKGHNFEITRDMDGKFNIKYMMEEGEVVPKLDSPSLTLKLSKKFPPQNIYKALSRFAMGILDDETLKSFEQTRRWLMGEDVEKELPRIARIDYSQVLQHPRIMVYIRHNVSRNDLPHVVVELRVINIAFIYILPFSDKDVCDYTSDEDFMRFWQFFDVYNVQKGVKFMSFVEKSPQNPNVKLRISPSRVL